MFKIDIGIQTNYILSKNDLDKEMNDTKYVYNLF